MKNSRHRRKLEQSCSVLESFLRNHKDHELYESARDALYEGYNRISEMRNSRKEKRQKQ